MKVNRVNATTLNVTVASKMWNKNQMLIYYNETATTKAVNNQVLTSDDIKCLLLLNQNVLVINLTSEMIYSFCILENSVTLVFPFNCVGYYLTSFDDSTSDNNSRFSMEQKTIGIVIVVGIFIACLWAGLLMGLFVIRRNSQNSKQNVLECRNVRTSVPHRRSSVGGSIEQNYDNNRWELSLNSCHKKLIINFLFDFSQILFGLPK